MDEAERAIHWLLDEDRAEYEGCATAAKALAAALDALRKDAERYRWLRDAENGGAFSVGQQCSVCDEYPKYEEVAWYYGIELDSLIDTAMQARGALGAA